MVDTARFGIGILFALIGAAILFVSRGSRGFTQRKQAGALLIVAAIVFVAIGLGLLDL